MKKALAILLMTLTVAGTAQAAPMERKLIVKIRTSLDARDTRTLKLILRSLFSNRRNKLIKFSELPLYFKIGTPARRVRVLCYDNTGRGFRKRVSQMDDLMAQELDEAYKVEWGAVAGNRSVSNAMLNAGWRMVPR